MAVIKFHGTIELRAPDDISTYEAWQKLESFLESASDNLEGDTDLYILDFFAAIIESRDGVQKTAHYEAWEKEVRKDG